MGKSKKINSLEATTTNTQGNNSPNSTGYGQQSFYDFWPRFNGDKKNWSKYESLFQASLRLVFSDNDFDIENSTPDATQNTHIYLYLSRTIPDTLFHLIKGSKYENDGQLAYKKIKTHITGRTDDRILSFLKSFGHIRFTEGDNIDKFIESLHTLDRNDLHYNALNRDKVGKNMIVALALDALPRKYHTFRQTIQVMPQLPNLDEFCERLKSESITLLNMEPSTSTYNATVNPIKTSTSMTNKEKFFKKTRKYGNRNNLDSGNLGQGHYNSSSSRSSRSSGGRRPEWTAGQKPRISTANGKKFFNKNPVSCERCLSRDGSHTAKECRASKWCGICYNASHDQTNCRKSSTNNSK